MDPERLERRAVRGAGALVGRSLALQLVTAAGTIALARLLVPEDYGIFAIALVVQQIGRSLVELGLPVPLIQREAPPTLHEQRAVTGIVLAVGVSLAATACALAFYVLPAAGEESDVARGIAITFAAVPILAFRLVPVVLIERELEFGRLIAVEVSETVAFYLFAVTAAAAGAGSYALTTAVPASTLVGVAVALAVKPWRFGLRIDLAAIRPMARFGMAAAAFSPIHTARELGIISVCSLTGGTALAGFYSFAQRLFVIHLALLASLQRVALPALSRVARGAERGRRATRAVAVSATAAGALTAVVAGAADPLIHVLFGSRWAPAADVVLVSAAGMLVAASGGAIGASLALSNRDGRSPVVAALASAATGWLAAIVLVPGLETTGAGLASGAALLVGAAVLLMRLRDQVSSTALLKLGVTVAVAMAAALIADSLTSGHDLVALVQAVAIAAAVWAAGSVLLLREDLELAWAVLRRNLRRGEGPLEPIESAFRT